VHPRFGQRSFRILVTDAYERRCVITGERTPPVLDTAHIMPFSICQRHERSNGVLMRSDLHRLFDGGYLTIDPVDRTVVVSNRIRKEFDTIPDALKPTSALSKQAISKNYWHSFRPGVAVLYVAPSRLLKTHQEMHGNRQPVISASNKNQLPPALLEPRQLPKSGRMIANGGSWSRLSLCNGDGGGCRRTA